MKSLVVICSALLFSTSTLYAEPLAAGKPAGLHRAQFEDGNGMFVVAGAALVGITIALATASNNVGAPAQTSPGTSTSTSTTGTNP